MTSARTLHEQRQEGDEEHQEDGDDTVLDPIEDRDEVVAVGLADENIALGVDPADGELFVEGAEVKDCGESVPSIIYATKLDTHE